MASLLVRELNLASFVFAFELRPPIHFFVLVEYPNVVPPLIRLPMARAFCQIRQAKKMFVDEVQSLHAHAASFRGWKDQICVFARLPPFDLWASHLLWDLWLVFGGQLMCRFFGMGRRQFFQVVQLPGDLCAVFFVFSQCFGLGFHDVSDGAGKFTYYFFKILYLVFHPSLSVLGSASFFVNDFCLLFHLGGQMLEFST